MKRKVFPTLSQALPHRKPLKAFTTKNAVQALRHLQSKELRTGGRPRFICSVLGVIYERTKNRKTRRLILEAVWMGFRMSVKLQTRKKP